MTTQKKQQSPRLTMIPTHLTQDLGFVLNVVPVQAARWHDGYVSGNVTIFQ